MTITIVSDSVLIESKSARDHQIERVSHEDAQSILAKVNALYFAVWKRIKTSATQQITDCYQEVVQ